MRDKKTTVMGIAAALTALLPVFGVDVPPEAQSSILGGILALTGILAKDSR